MPNATNNQYLGVREIKEEVFLDTHGIDQTKSVSVATTNDEDEPVLQYPAGQIVGKRHDDLFAPLAYEAADGAVSSANVISVAETRMFRVGDLVELPTSVAADATRFRQVTAVDHEAGTITLDGAAFSLSDGDTFEVDPTRSYGFVPTGSGTTGTTIPLGTGEAARFEVGDKVEIEDDGSGPYDVTAVDTGADELTIGTSISFSGDDIVVSDKGGDYRIGIKTVNSVDHTELFDQKFTHQNVDIPTRPHGEVDEDALWGLTPDAKTALQGPISFTTL
ncbi:MAG: hypothetical protein U5L04_01740 [Trueperaceae bacterium]|nr:hypothetical protein [Trueperaceae bacterium]